MTLKHPASRAANIALVFVTAGVYLVAVLQAGRVTISDPSTFALAVDCAIAAIPAATVMAFRLRVR